MAYVYTSSNPCLCSGGPTNPPGPECPDDCNCLKVCNIRVNANDQNAVGPCAKTGTLNLMSDVFGHDFCACGNNTPKWTIEHKDSSIFVSASVTRAGVLTWVTGGVNTVGEYGKIILKVCCGSLSYYTEVLIGVKDLCNCPDCNDCEICDQCTGDCIEPNIHLYFPAVPQSGNTSLNASS